MTLTVTFYIHLLHAHSVDSFTTFVVTKCDLDLDLSFVFQPFWWLREMRRGLMAVTEPTKGDQSHLTSMTEQSVVEMYHALDPAPSGLMQRISFRKGAGSKLREYLERCLLR
jgi:hypothetical protein